MICLSTRCGAIAVATSACGGRRQHNHDDFHAFDGVADLDRDPCQFAETMRRAFVAIQFDATAFFDDFNMAGIVRL
jgi:hypothetical protein